MREENDELGLGEEQANPGSEELSTPIDEDTGPPPLEDIEEPQEPSPPAKKSKKKKKKARGMAIEVESTEPHASTNNKVEDLTQPIEILKLETEGAPEEKDGEDNVANGDQDEEMPTLTKREKRRAKEAAKKAREAEAPTPQVSTRSVGLSTRAKMSR